MEYTEPSSGQGVIAGPTVGPDGNIYVISDLGGLGAFALSPAGQLLWSNSGNPTFTERGQIGAEIVFGPGRLFAAFDEYCVASSTMFGLSLGGAQQWARAIAGSDDHAHATAAPTCDRLGRKPLPDRDGRRERVEPPPGPAEHWGRALGLLAVAVERHVGAECRAGRLYLPVAKPQLPRFGDTGRAAALDVLRRLDHRPSAVTPDGSIVVAGSRPNFGEPGSVRGWNAATGSLAWQVDLPNENGGYQIAYTRPRFSADSQTAYFGTAILGGRG